MKIFTIIIAVIFLLTSISFARTVRVRGSVRKSSKIIAPHYRTSPDSTRINNWSTKGNINPFTGKRGRNIP